MKEKENNWFVYLKYLLALFKTIPRTTDSFTTDITGFKEIILDLK